MTCCAVALLGILSLPVVAFVVWGLIASHNQYKGKHTRELRDIVIEINDSSKQSIIEEDEIEKSKRLEWEDGEYKG